MGELCLHSPKLHSLLEAGKHGLLRDISNNRFSTYAHTPQLLPVVRFSTAVVSTVSQVKFLERNLEQAKHVESGRNALIQQITRLEEEAKHARRRLEIYRAEALVRSVTPLDEIS